MNADASHGRAGRTNSVVVSWLLFPLVTQKTRVQLLTAEVLLTLALGFCSGVGGCFDLGPCPFDVCFLSCLCLLCVCLPVGIVFCVVSFVVIACGLLLFVSCFLFAAFGV